MMKAKKKYLVIAGAAIVIAAAFFIVFAVYTNMGRGHSLVGTWTSEAGSVTHFYQDDTGKTVDDAGEHEFTWKIISLKEAIIERKSDINIFLRTVYGEEFVNAIFEIGHGEGEEFVNSVLETGWGENDYLISVVFDDIPAITFEFPYTMENRDTMMINTMSMGQILSPRPNPNTRLEWIVLKRAD